VLDRESGVELQLWKSGGERYSNGKGDERDVAVELRRLFEHRIALGD
jgi:hypothetical protein